MFSFTSTAYKVTIDIDQTYTKSSGEDPTSLAESEVETNPRLSRQNVADNISRCKATVWRIIKHRLVPSVLTDEDRESTVLLRLYNEHEFVGMGSHRTGRELILLEF